MNFKLPFGEICLYHLKRNRQIGLELFGYRSFIYLFDVQLENRLDRFPLIQWQWCLSFRSNDTIEQEDLLEHLLDRPFKPVFSLEWMDVPRLRNELRRRSRNDLGCEIVRKRCDNERMLERWWDFDLNTRLWS
ncbi:hypothetical protein C495_05913 [Natronorubrum sulfidifaciens JCM 14089]|uniref:Uncharacterized protein n=1 Tax=Natronorubrum sulfidifaciens JCM 14089 TaxID=1230460 RepID=L9WAY1_9EURY|nr:hypothetical protein C495_05913 [Natronorubrum sulfidifaciens JCM 14089]